MGVVVSCVGVGSSWASVVVLGLRMVATRLFGMLFRNVFSALVYGLYGYVMLFW